MGDRLTMGARRNADSRGPAAAGFGDTAFTQNRTEPLHRWVPWVAGFSASFVGEVLDAAGGGEPGGVLVLDPFAGVGTTLVEAMRRGHAAVGFEINPYAALVCRTKLGCLGYDLARVRRALASFGRHMRRAARRMPKAEPPAGFASRVPFFSPLVERKVLHVLDFIAGLRERWLRDVFKVALGAVLVAVSNYSYEPSLGRRATAGKADIVDADVGGLVAAKLEEMLADMAEVQARALTLGSRPQARVFAQSFLTRHSRLAEGSVDFLITSPPYLNNYHYIRNTRPHLFWLGLVRHRSELAAMERASFGKFWQTVRSGPRVELEARCDGLAEAIEELRRRNPHKGIYGGGGWANYAATYFNDCLAFCRAARRAMRPGGTMVVVIGNNVLQGIEFRTDRYFASIAEGCGFELVRLHRVREKRTGSSIIKSSVRVGKAAARVELYETAVELRAAPAGRASGR